MKNKKILILVPGPNASGGITNYYYSIRKHLDDNFIFLVRGTRNWPYHSNIFTEIIRLIRDYFNFIVILYTEEIQAVQTTTTLGKSSLMRDSVYIVISKLLRIKTVIFFRGWNPKNEKIINSIFLKIIFSTDAIIVLNSYVNLWLIKKGYNKKIYVETTLVDSDLLNTISIDIIVDKYKKKSELSILFMARIEKEKGIYETIDSFGILKNSYPDIKLYIAGCGREENAAKNYVKQNDIDDIIFLGHISGKQKIHYLESSHLYLFPSYTEGMPNSVLEAMSFGLPVIVRNVGGLVDIIKNYENGFITESYKAEEFAKLIKILFNDKELMLKIGLKNYKIAKDRFRSDVVAERIISIFEEI